MGTNFNGPFITDAMQGRAVANEIMGSVFPFQGDQLWVTSECYNFFTINCHKISFWGIVRHSIIIRLAFLYVVNA